MIHIRTGSLFFLTLCFWANGLGAESPSPLQELALEQVEQLSPRIKELAGRLWTLAETELEEHHSVQVLSRVLEAEGFAVEPNAAGLATAFVASWGEGKPIIGLLADYDALPEVGNAPVPRAETREDGVSSGHACGHNLLAAGSVAAAIAVKHVFEEKAIPGTIRLYGTPAEESKLGKVYLARAGLFDDLDASLTWHPAPRTAVGNQTGTALNDFSVEFFGTTAHSAARPWEGRSALDALEMFNFGVNLLREHMRPSARIQYVIQEGGETPREVPHYTRAWYWIRGSNRLEVDSLFERIRKVAEGAATATETRVKVKLRTGVHEILLNRPLQEALQRNLELLGAPHFSPEELTFAEQLQIEMGLEKRGFDTRIKPLPAGPSPPAAGSNDLAEVSWITPAARFLMTAIPPGVDLHSREVSACFGTLNSWKPAVRAAGVLTLTALDLFTDENLRSRARGYFLEKTGGKPYRSPIAGNDGIPEGP